MKIDKGSIVTRNSYNNDVIFVVTKIEGNVAYLKGTDVRLYADALLEDLVLAEATDDYRPEISNELLERDEYFYLPGKILHIDAVYDLCSKFIN
ncbi:MAG: hypothetical protein HFI73_05870 [Bacilli bacterium]|jgi:spore coat assembly protein|nr:hypothetical protein [Bacilli bacterium]